MSACGEKTALKLILSPTFTRTLFREGLDRAAAAVSVTDVTSQFKCTQTRVVILLAQSTALHVALRSNIAIRVIGGFILYYIQMIKTSLTEE